MAGRSKDVAPAFNGVAVTEHDTNLIPPTRALYVGVAGDLVVDFVGGGTDVTIKSAAVGYHVLQVVRVKTATTATDIVALY